MKHKTKRRRTNTRAIGSAKNKDAVPRTAKQFFALSDEGQDRWTRVAHVVSKMRADRLSLTKASQEFGLDRQTVLRFAAPALRKRSNGQYVARARDTLLRVLAVPAPDGLHEVAVRDSREATQIAQYWVAVQRYLQTGDASGLQKFKGKRIKDASGKSIRLIADTHELDRLGNAGVLSFESLYARSA